MKSKRTLPSPKASQHVNEHNSAVKKYSKYESLLKIPVFSIDKICFRDWDNIILDFEIKYNCRPKHIETQYKDKTYVYVNHSSNILVV